MKDTTKSATVGGLAGLLMGLCATVAVQRVDVAGNGTALMPEVEITEEARAQAGLAAEIRADLGCPAAVMRRGTGGECWSGMTGDDDRPALDERCCNPTGELAG